MDFPIGDLNQVRNLAADVEGGMELDGPFLGAEPRPGKQRQTKIDRGGINRTQIVLKGEARGCPGTEGSALLQELVEEGFVNLERALLIGLRQRGACCGLQPQVVPSAVPNGE